MLYYRNFVFWKLPQLQYKNPAIQVVTFKNMTPSPFIRCYFGKVFFVLFIKVGLKVLLLMSIAELCKGTINNIKYFFCR